VTLGEFDLQDQAFEINKRASEIAREAAETFKGDGRTRFVLGGIGPGTKLPSLGHIDYDTLESAFAIQAAGLIAGGCDAILIETCQDPLQIKAAASMGLKIAREKAGVEIPILRAGDGKRPLETLLVRNRSRGGERQRCRRYGVDGMG
jgi:5-methyltetrahydrofolate--homocysteine methyltransferase